MKSIREFSPMALECGSYLELFSDKPKSNNSIMNEYIMGRTDELDKIELYQYHLKHSEIDILNKIFSAKEDWYSHLAVKLCGAYDKLIEGNHLDIITDIINQGLRLDQSAIMVVSIHKKRYDIIQQLIDNNFPLSEVILLCNGISFDSFMYENIDALRCAIIENDLEMCKFFVEKGANAEFNGLPNACKWGDIDIVSYFLQFSSHIRSPDYFGTMIWKSNNNLDKIRLILEVIVGNGLDLNSIDPGILGKIIGGSNIETLELLQQYGLEFISDFVDVACIFRNISITKYFLQLGFRPRESTVEKIFLDMNTNMNMINLFLDHNIDLSNLPITSEYNDLIQRLESNGMHMEKIIFYLLKNLDKSKSRTSGYAISNWANSDII